MNLDGADKNSEEYKNAMRLIEDYRRGFENFLKGEGLPADVPGLIAAGRAKEDEGDCFEAYRLYCFACELGGKDEAAAHRDRACDLCREMQNDMIRSNPLGSLRFSSKGCFESACCEEMREKILNGEAGLMYGCERTELTLEEDDTLCYSDNCPYCGKEPIFPEEDTTD